MKININRDIINKRSWLESEERKKNAKKRNEIVTKDKQTR